MYPKSIWSYIQTRKPYVVRKESKDYLKQSWIDSINAFSKTVSKRNGTPIARSQTKARQQPNRPIPTRLNKRMNPRNRNSKQPVPGKNCDHNRRRQSHNTNPKNTNSEQNQDVVNWKNQARLKLLLHINPNTIKYFLKVDRNKAFAGAPKNMTARTFKGKRYVGIVVNDQALTYGRPLEKCRHVQAMLQHFCEGKEWEQTEYLNLYKKKYEQKQIRRNQGNSFNDFLQNKN